MTINHRLQCLLLALSDISLAQSCVRLSLMCHARAERQYELFNAKRCAASASHWFRVWLHGIA